MMNALGERKLGNVIESNWEGVLARLGHEKLEGREWAFHVEEAKAHGPGVLGRPAKAQRDKWGPDPLVGQASEMNFELKDLNDVNWAVKFRRSLRNSKCK